MYQQKGRKSIMVEYLRKFRYQCYSHYSYFIWKNTDNQQDNLNKQLLLNSQPLAVNHNFNNNKDKDSFLLHK